MTSATHLTSATENELQRLSQEPVWKVPNGKVPLERGQVHLWLGSLVVSDAQYAAAREILSVEETESFDVILDSARRRCAVAARATLRLQLSSYIGVGPKNIEIHYGPGGKPSVIPECGLWFNLTHSGQAALYAFSPDGEVGIDMETVGTLEEATKLASRFLPVDGKARFLLLPQAEQARFFYKAWTEEEALLKAEGAGVAALGQGARARRSRHALFDVPVGAGRVATLAAPRDVTRVVYLRTEGLRS